MRALGLCDHETVWCNGKPRFWALIRAQELCAVIKDKRDMDENTVVDQLFYSDTDDDWNNSDEEDSFVHGEDSFVLDRLTREQDGKMADR